MDTAAFRTAVASWWASKRHLSTLLFVLFLAYMPIVSASLRALDCIAPVAGVQYLRSDLRVECGVGEHAIARALAITVLVVLGAGFPAGLAWLLGTARNDQLVDPAFHATWGFLFDGYRAPSRTLAPPLATPGRNSVSGSKVFGSLRKVLAARKSLAATSGAVLTSGGSADSKAALAGASIRGARRRSSMMPERLTQSWVVSGDSRVWWEAIVLCRKAGVVLLAVTLTNPYLQCVGASLWFLGAFILQVRYAPYTKPLFNRLETASLVTTLLTAIISTALLQYNVGVTSAELHPPESMTGIEWTVTVALGVMNVGTFAALAVLWLRTQCARARGIVRRASFVSALSGRVAGLRALLARRRISDAAAETARSQSITDSAGGTSGLGGDAGATSIMNPLRLRVDAATTESKAPTSAAPAPAAKCRVKVSFPTAIIDAASNGTHVVLPAAADHTGDDAAYDDTNMDTGTVPHDTSDRGPVRIASHHVSTLPPLGGVAFAATPATRSRRKP